MSICTLDPNLSKSFTESSYEQHVTDHNGVSLLQFFHETLNKNAKDRNMLLKIEKELYSLATDKR